MKSLRKSQVPGAQVFASPSDHARWVTGPPPFFVFGFESDIATTTILNRLAGASDPSAVDAVFVLGRGAAVNFGDGQGTRRLRLANDTDAVGWAWVEGNPCLLELLAWLHALPHVEHQGAMLVQYLTQAAAEGGGSLVAFPQLGAAQDESAARSEPPH